MAGRRPFGTRDRSANVWWLAVLSFGESWHNLHHADPTCARHGVLRGQVDMSARLIWLFEKAGWVKEVRWPVAERVQAKLVSPQAPPAALPYASPRRARQEACPFPDDGGRAPRAADRDRAHRVLREGLRR